MQNPDDFNKFRTGKTVKQDMSGSPHARFRRVVACQADVQAANAGQQLCAISR